MHGISVKHVLNLLAEIYDCHWLPENWFYKKLLLCFQWTCLKCFRTKSDTIVPQNEFYEGLIANAISTNFVPQQHISVFWLQISDGSCDYRESDGGYQPVPLNWCKFLNDSDKTIKYFSQEKYIKWLLLYIQRRLRNLTVNYFWKKFHIRWLVWFWICLWILILLSTIWKLISEIISVM